MSQNAIEVNDVSMKFNLSREKVDSLKDYIFKAIKGELQYNEFWALRDINFSVEKGDRVGILGLNGAGKSTLLKVISGVFKPTTGSVKKHGKMVPLLELGAGFNMEYTGIEHPLCAGSPLEVGERQRPQVSHGEYHVSENSHIHISTSLHGRSSVAREAILVRVVHHISVERKLDIGLRIKPCDCISRVFPVIDRKSVV